MITLLRSSLKDGGMTTIVWVAVGSMIIGSALPLVMKKNSEEWALRINGITVPYTTYASELAMIRNYVTMLRSQYGQFADYLLQNMGFSDPQAMTVQQLITQQLMVHGFTAQGIRVSPESINRKMADKKFVEDSCGDLLPAFVYKNDHIDTAMLKLYLQQRGMTIDQVQERIQGRVGTVFMQQALEQLAYVTQNTIFKTIEFNNSIQELALVRIPISHYKKAVSADITDEQVRAFYDQENVRVRRYYAPEKRSGIIWEFDAHDYGTSVDSDTIARYYEEHKATRYQKEPATVEVRALRFTTRDQAELTRAMLIDTAQPFSSLVQEYPFDDESASHEGLLKPIVRGTGDRVIEKAAFILAQNGEISPVIAHTNGYLLLQRVSKTAAVITPLSKVQHEIKDQLQQASFKEECLAELHEIVKANNPAAITNFVKEHAGKRLPIEGAILADAKNDAQRSLFTLEEGAYTAVCVENRCYLVHLETIIPTVLQSYDMVAQAVRNDLIEYLAEKSLSEVALDFKRATAIQGIRAAAKEFGFPVINYTHKGVSDAAHATELRNKYGIDSRNLRALERVGTFTVAHHEGDVVIAALEGLIAPAQEPATSAAKDTADGLLKQERQTIVAGYIASLYRDATIEKNDILALLDKENTI